MRKKILNFQHIALSLIYGFYFNQNAQNKYECEEENKT